MPTLHCLNKKARTSMTNAGLLTSLLTTSPLPKKVTHPHALLACE